MEDGPGISQNWETFIKNNGQSLKKQNQKTLDCRKCLQGVILAKGGATKSAEWPSSAKGHFPLPLCQYVKDEN